jgi:hypothetical protein
MQFLALSLCECKRPPSFLDRQSPSQWVVCDHLQSRGMHNMDRRLP